MSEKVTTIHVHTGDKGCKIKMRSFDTWDCESCVEETETSTEVTVHPHKSWTGTISDNDTIEYIEEFEPDERVNENGVSGRGY
jgi:ribosomal protein L31